MAGEQTQRANLASRLPLRSSEDHLSLRDRILQMRTDALPGYDKLSDIQRYGAKIGLKALQTIMRPGYITPANFAQVIDFGAGDGGPTFSLTAVATECGGTVTAVEKNPLSTTKIVAAEILPQERVFREDDGTVFLQAPERANEYSLITAFKLTYQFPTEVFRGLVTGAANALKDDGSLMVTSDVETMSEVYDFIKDQGLPELPTFIIGETNSASEERIDILVIPKKTCQAIADRI